MEDTFDYQRYVEAVNQFLLDMIYVVEDTDVNIPRYVYPVAELLRIGRIEAMIYENPDCEERDNGILLLLHDTPRYDPDRSTYKREIIANGNIVHYRFYQRMGEPLWDDAEGVRLSAFERLLVVFQERLRMKGVVEYFMNYDIMLHVHNTRYLVNKMSEIIGRGMLSDYGLCCLNFKQFSLINDLVGRQNGTKVMLDYTEKITSMFTDPYEALGRIGGDRFSVLFRKEHLDTLLSYLEELAIPTEAPFYSEVVVSAWAGIYMLPDEELRPSDIMDRAMLALSEAKRRGSSTAVYYDEKMLADELNAKRMQALFPGALVNEEFQVYYQPKVYLKDYVLAGAEALCRWVHEGEFITPDKFIPVFEKSTLITELDFYMLEHVCCDIRRWLDTGRDVVPISVNFSRRHFKDRMLFEHMMEIIDRYQVPHRLIEIELTESASDVDSNFLKEFITKLKAAGISVSIDDFGTGYSSLNLLRELPWDVIKLDKSLLNKDKNDIHSQMMLGHIIYMAKEFGIKCICEGVETLDHIQVLKESGCLLAQGFYFDRPLPVSDFETRLENKLAHKEETVS